MFRSKGNEKHFDRSLRYLEFILEVRSAICDQDLTTALTTLDVFAEAIKNFQKDVITADKYEGGWQLVERWKGYDEEESELRKLNEKILEERSKRRRMENQRIRREESLTSTLSNILQAQPSQKTSADIQQSADQQGRFPARRGPAKNFGPCIWCSQQGHGYKVKICD